MRPRDKKSVAKRQAHPKPKKLSKSTGATGTGYSGESDEKRPKRVVAPPKYYQQDLDEEEIMKRAIRQSLKDLSHMNVKVVGKKQPTSEENKAGNPVKRKSSHKNCALSKQRISQQRVNATLLKANESISRAKAMKQRCLKGLVHKRTKSKSKTVKITPNVKRERKVTHQNTKKQKPAVIPLIDDFINYVIQSNVCIPEPRLVALFEDRVSAPTQVSTPTQASIIVDNSNTVIPFNSTQETLALPVKCEKVSVLEDRVKPQNYIKPESRTTRSKNRKAT